ncbi:MAG: C10 family peptidase [Desulfuromonadaceae bacterium]
MKSQKILSVVLLVTVVLVSIISSTAWAKPATSAQAMAVVNAWRKKEAKPLKAALGKTTRSVRTFKDAAGTELYHVVSLDPTGFVIVPADDLIEPIIAFSSEGTYDPSGTNPLGALVSRDLPGRIAHVRAKTVPAKSVSSNSVTSEQAIELNKWETLLGITPELSYGITTLTLSDMRVSPLIQSTWGQSTVNNLACYNYYTPENYVTGCVATALSQLMRFHQKPTSLVGTQSFAITVDGVSRSEQLMGGDGTGGAYNWSQMPLVPDATITEPQRQAIGRLLHDTGVSVEMDYTAGSSGADATMAATSLIRFGYGNAIAAFNSNNDIPSSMRNQMVNPNLDAGLPVLLGISGDYGGHAVLADGYGYQSTTLYHHLNMGWSGSYDLWYNLPTITDQSFGFSSVQTVIYNVYTSGSGEIISGRIVDCAGAPAHGVTVTASLSGSVVASTTTNSNGIYALKGLLPETNYSIVATRNGYVFASQTAETETSVDMSITVGNKWGVNFSATACSASTLNTLLSGAGSGAINSLPIGISCGTDCSESFLSPSTITLTAKADSGFAFTGWSGGGCSGNSSTCAVDLTSVTTVTANFEPVSAIVSEAFSGTSAPGGWTAVNNVPTGGRNWAFGLWPCSGTNQTGGTGNYAFADASCGESIQNVDSSLISPSYNLSHYSGIVLSFKTYINFWNSSAGDVDVSNDGGSTWTNVWRKGPGTNGTHYGPAAESVDITSLASGKADVTVRFRYYTGNYGSFWEVDDFTLSGSISPAANYSTLSVTKSGSGSGTVVSSPVGISCGASCSAGFLSPTPFPITLTAQADSGFAFTGWSGGGCSGNSSRCVVDLTSDTTVTANFEPVSAFVSETFSGTSAPGGWTAVNNLSSGGRNWAFGLWPCYPGTNQTGGTGNNAFADASCGGSILNVDSSLISPGYNLSRYSGIVLSFKTYIDFWNSSAGDVDVSNDGGSTWTNVWRKGPGTNYTHYGPATESVDITSLASGRADVKVRFRYYTGSYGSYWEIDDFTLSGSYNPQTITFNAIPTQTYGTADFDPGATASSGLTVTYTSSNTAVATIVSGRIHIVGAGTSTITAKQGGDATTWQAATDVLRTLTANKATATVTLGGLSQTYDGSAKAVTVSTTPSGLSYTVTYNGLSTVPSAVNSYAVIAAITDANYQGNAEGTLVINAVIMVGAKGFSSIQAAYDDSATATNAIIKLLEGELTGDFTAGRNITVSLEGGYNASYSGISTRTAIKGRFVLKNGTVKIRGINVR